MRTSPQAHARHLIKPGPHGGISLAEGREGVTLIAETLVRGVSRRFMTALTSEQVAKLSHFSAHAAARDITQEVERKWCPTDPSHLEYIARLEASATKTSLITQGYLCAGSAEARLRRKDDDYFLTLKSAGSIARREVEVPLSLEQFEQLWGGTEDRRLEKTRSVLSLENASGESLTVEVDRFYGSCSSLVLVELEFPSIQRAGEFVAPTFFGSEVTDDSHYKNKSLACVGLPITLLSSISRPRVA